MTWPEAFVWTLALELPVYTAFLRRAFRPWWGPVALTFAVNVATHPLLWIFLPREDPSRLWLALFEGLVALVEAGLVALALVRLGSPPVAPRAALGRGLAAAVLANGLSLSSGLVKEWLGW